MLGVGNFAKAIDQLLMPTDVFILKPLESDCNSFHLYFQTSRPHILPPNSKFQQEIFMMPKNNALPKTCTNFNGIRPSLYCSYNNAVQKLVWMDSILWNALPSYYSTLAINQKHLCHQRNPGLHFHRASHYNFELELKINANTFKMEAISFKFCLTCTHV